MKVFTLLCLIGLAFSLYDSRSKVIQITPQNFKEKVLNSKGLWLIEFFAPWCGHCKALAPEYDKVAKQFEGIVNIGAIDADAYKELGGQYGIKGFPTIKFFGDNKNNPQDYNGERNANAISDYLQGEIRKAISSRSGSSSGSSNKSSSREDRKKSSGSSGSQDDVVVLEDSTFDQNVKNSKDSWFVEFYAPWCGHCKKLEPEWNKVGSELKGKVKVAKVDATAATTLASRFGVSGYPTIKFFPAGFSRDGDALPYDGARDAQSMIDWALEQSSKSKKVEIIELYESSTFQSNCVEFNGVCLIAFLPHIYDSTAAERQNYLNILLESAKTAKNKPVNILWTQGGDNYEFEEALQSSAGYPGVLALSGKKLVFAKLRGAFSKSNIDSFITNVLSGKEQFQSIKQLPKFNNVQKWDGKDHQKVYDDSEL